MKSDWELDFHSIKSGLNAGRKRSSQCLVIQVDMHVGQDCPFRLEPLDPGERLIDGQVVRMRRVTQCIDDPHIEILESAFSLTIKIADIRRVSETADPECESV